MMLCDAMSSTQNSQKQEKKQRHTQLFFLEMRPIECDTHSYFFGNETLSVTHTAIFLEMRLIECDTNSYFFGNETNWAASQQLPLINLHTFENRMNVLFMKSWWRGEGSVLSTDYGTHLRYWCNTNDMVIVRNANRDHHLPLGYLKRPNHHSP